MADIKLGLIIGAVGGAKTVKELLDIAAAAKQAGSSSGEDSKKAGVSIADLAFKFNNVVGAIQNLAAAAKPAYDFLIGSNERLNAQLLTSQANLASSTRIFKGGIEIVDPTEKIKASQPALKAALKQIEKDTQSLVGVTSQDVNELFQITLGNASQLNNQSKDVAKGLGDPIKAATSLTKGFAATLQTMNVPLNQARQEINSILKGQLDQNSIIGKNLGLTNEQVNKWKGQGTLVDELNKKLEVYVAGNKLASQSIEGNTSNIRDVFEQVGRSAGEPILAPLVNSLNEFYQYLQKNQEGITAFFKRIVEEGVGTGQGLLQAIQPQIDALLGFLAAAGPAAASLFSLVGKGLENAERFIGPLVTSILGALTLAAQAVEVLSTVANQDKIDDATDAISALSEQSGVLEEQSLRTGKKLKELNEIQQKNGSLTEEQARKLAGYTKIGQENVAAIDDQIKALKALNPVSEANAARRNAEVAALERTKEALEKSSGGIRLQGKALAELGSSYEQLEKKAANSANALANATTSDEAGKAAKELTQVIEQQVELGQISAEQGAAQLAKIASNSALEVDTQQKAQEAIRKIRTKEIGDQVKDLEAQSAKVQAEAESGKVKPVAAAQEITRLKKQQLDLQLDDVRKEIAAEEAAIAVGRGSKDKLQELTTKKTKLEGDDEKSVAEGEKRVQDARLKEIDDSYKKQNDIASLAESRKNADLADRQLEGKVTAKEAEGEKLGFTKTRIGSEVSAEKQKLAALNAIQASTPEQAKKLEADKIASNKRLADLEIQAAQNEIAIRKNALDKIADENQKADLKRQTAEKEAVAQVVELQQQGKVSATQVEAVKSQLTEDRLNKEIDQERETQNKINALPAGEDRDKALLESQGKAAEKRVALADAVNKKEEALRKEAADRVERANRDALNAVERAGEERQIDAEKLIRAGVISEENANVAKTQATQERLKIELDTAQKQQQELERLADGAETGKAREDAEKSVQEARKKTNAVTLQLLDSEKSAQEALAKVAIAEIEREQNARNRQYQAQIFGLEEVKQRRSSATIAAEIAAQRETLALDAATKALERQSSLLQAKANYQKATADLATTEGQIDVDRAKRAVEVAKQLEGQNVSAQERAALERELATLGIASGTSATQLVQRQILLENQLAEQKRSSMLAEQAQARASLELELRRNQLANSRAVIEARITELKAKASLADAQSALAERRVADSKAITTAESNLQKAQQEVNPIKRAEAIAQATADLQSAKSSARVGQAQSADAIGLAREQVEAAKQNTKDTVAQRTEATEIEQLSRKSLEAQQLSALKQADAADAARRNADNLELAKTQAEGIASAMERAKAAQSGGAPAQAAALPGRKDGGSVAAGQAYVVGEQSAEVFVPGASGTILNQGQIARNLSAFQAAQSLAGVSPAGLTLQGGMIADGGGNAELIKAFQSLEKTIADRPVALNMPVSFDGPDSKDWDQQFKLLRSISRGGL